MKSILVISALLLGLAAIGCDAFLGSKMPSMPNMPNIPNVPNMPSMPKLPFDSKHVKRSIDLPRPCDDNYNCPESSHCIDGHCRSQQDVLDDAMWLPACDENGECEDGGECINGACFNFGPENEE